MDERNVATLPACQRLEKAGIRMETEACWQYQDPCSPDDMAYGCYGSWSLVSRSINHLDAECTPAPSMAEVWRELPPGTELRKAHSFTEAFSFADTENADSIYPPCNSPDNPADALIELLIWVKRQGKEQP